MAIDNIIIIHAITGVIISYADKGKGLNRNCEEIIENNITLL